MKREETFRNIIANNKKILLAGAGVFGILSINSIANGEDFKIDKTNEFYYDVRGSINLNKYDFNYIMPMDNFKKHCFPKNDSRVPIYSKASIYLTDDDYINNEYNFYNDIEKAVRTDIYYQSNKQLTDKNFKNINPDKVVYLTFNNGPSKNTQEIISILDKNKVKGTFFFLGENMEINQEIVKEASKSGHIIGLHSYSNSYKNLYKTENGLINEFNQAKSLYKDITGEDTNIIRIPYGSNTYLSKKDITPIVENGYKFWDWNVDSNDTNSKGKNKEGIIKSVKRAIDSNTKEMVLLMHEKNNTVEALDDVIKLLKSEGYTIKVATEHIDSFNHWGIK